MIYTAMNWIMAAIVVALGIPLVGLAGIILWITFAKALSVVFA